MSTASRHDDFSVFTVLILTDHLVVLGGDRTALYLQDVALLDGGVLQLAGFLLQNLSCAADSQAGHYLLWKPEGALTLLYCRHLLLEALHFHQQTLIREWRVARE